jgi:hypothetical protein
MNGSYDLVGGGLLNNQPMGNYSPTVWIKDAQHLGPRVRPIEVQRSEGCCVLAPEGSLSLRIGFNYAKGLRHSCGAVVGTLQQQSVRTSCRLRDCPPAPRHSQGLCLPLLEDETGIANIVLVHDLFELNRSVVLGHADTKSMEPYQHHNLDSVWDAINIRTLGVSKSGHIFGHISPEGAGHKSRTANIVLKS